LSDEETNGETQETKGAERFPVVFLGALESLRLSIYLLLRQKRVGHPTQAAIIPKLHFDSRTFGHFANFS
jgi:hypothetical protein